MNAAPFGLPAGLAERYVGMPSGVTQAIKLLAGPGGERTSLRPPYLPPIPGRHGLRIGPEPLAGLPGGLLDLRELALFLSYCPYRQASALATCSRFT